MARTNLGRLVILCEEKRPRYINDQEIPNWQQGPSISAAVNYISEALNYLACRGWMPFSETSALRLGHGKLTLVRPKQ